MSANAPRPPTQVLFFETRRVAFTYVLTARGSARVPADLQWARSEGAAVVGLAAECPLCDEELGDLPGWDTAPENAIAFHLQHSHPGWEQRLGFFADVLETLDAAGTSGTTGQTSSVDTSRPAGGAW